MKILPEVTQATLDALAEEERAGGQQYLDEGAHLLQSENPLLANMIAMSAAAETGRTRRKMLETAAVSYFLLRKQALADCTRSN